MDVGIIVGKDGDELENKWVALKVNSG